MAHFEVGKKVIAIKTHVQLKFKKGDVFELNAIRKSACDCCGVAELDVGILSPFIGKKVIMCFAHNTTEIDKGIWWFKCTSFAPYDDTLSELTAEQILEETPEHIEV